MSARVLDADDRDCTGFLRELRALAEACDASHLTLLRLAIEEVEAWYLGDRSALPRAYPRATIRVLDDCIQDSACGTREVLADAIQPGGMHAIRQAGWPLPGQVKHEWAERIGPLLDPASNLSSSFGKLRDGMLRLASSPDRPAQPGVLDG